mgnify:CR=1 FL=1
MRTMAEHDIVLGKDVQIGRFAMIGDGARIGDRCVLGEETVVDKKAVLDEGCILGKAAVVAEEARLGKDTALLHIKDFIPYAEERGQQLKASVPNTDVFSNVVSCAAGLGDMDYAPLCALAKERSIPMTLENTNPGNAEAAREHLEKIGASL